MMNSFSLVNTTKGKLPRLPFAQMKDAILGKNYDLSVAIIGDTKMRKENLSRRGKDYVTDILSFPFAKNSGEILINLNACKKKSKEFDRSYENYLAFLFIHGLVHLKGYDHGSTMDSIEAKFCKQFSV